jgi:hypothetical protein
MDRPMHDYALAHLADSVLLRDLAALVARDRTTTASLLAHIAEVDARKLYAPAGHSSMFAYCVDELRLSEDAAAKRIQAARAARRFPILFAGLAEGQLHLAAVCLLAPHLTPENSDDLIQASAGRKKSEIEAWLARRFLIPGRPTIVRAVSPAPVPQHSPGHVGVGMLDLSGSPSQQEAEHAPGHVPVSKVEPEERYLIQVTVSKSTHDKLRYAQALLSHAVPRGEVAEVLDRALDTLISQLERRKFGAARCETKAGASRPKNQTPRRSVTQARRDIRESSKAEAMEQSRDVIAGLRRLGCRADEARRAMELSEIHQGATLEERMKAALSSLGQRPRRGLPPSGTLPGWESSIGSGKG